MQKKKEKKHVRRKSTWEKARKPNYIRIRVFDKGYNGFKLVK